MKGVAATTTAVKDAADALSGFGATNSRSVGRKHAPCQANDVILGGIFEGETYQAVVRQWYNHAQFRKRLTATTTGATSSSSSTSTAEEEQAALAQDIWIDLCSRNKCSFWNRSLTSKKNGTAMYTVETDPHVILPAIRASLQALADANSVDADNDRELPLPGADFQSREKLPPATIYPARTTSSSAYLIFDTKPDGEQQQQQQANGTNTKRTPRYWEDFLPAPTLQEQESGVISLIGDDSAYFYLTGGAPGTSGVATTSNVAAAAPTNDENNNSIRSNHPAQGQAAATNNNENDMWPSGAMRVPKRVSASIEEILDSIDIDWCATGIAEPGDVFGSLPVAPTITTDNDNGNCDNNSLILGTLPLTAVDTSWFSAGSEETTANYVSPETVPQAKALHGGSNSKGNCLVNVPSEVSFTSSNDAEDSGAIAPVGVEEVPQDGVANDDESSSFRKKDEKKTIESKKKTDQFAPPTVADIPLHLPPMPNPVVPFLGTTSTHPATVAAKDAAQESQSLLVAAATAAAAAAAATVTKDTTKATNDMAPSSASTDKMDEFIAAALVAQRPPTSKPAPLELQHHKATEETTAETSKKLAAKESHQGTKLALQAVAAAAAAAAAASGNGAPLTAAIGQQVVGSTNKKAPPATPPVAMHPSLFAGKQTTTVHPGAASTFCTPPLAISKPIARFRPKGGSAFTSATCGPSPVSLQVLRRGAPVPLAPRPVEKLVQGFANLEARARTAQEQHSSEWQRLMAMEHQMDQLDGAGVATAPVIMTNGNWEAVGVGPYYGGVVPLVPTTTVKKKRKKAASASASKSPPAKKAKKGATAKSSKPAAARKKKAAPAAAKSPTITKPSEQLGGAGVATAPANMTNGHWVAAVGPYYGSALQLVPTPATKKQRKKVAPASASKPAPSKKAKKAKPAAVGKKKAAASKSPTATKPASSLKKTPKKATAPKKKATTTKVKKAATTTKTKKAATSTTTTGLKKPTATVTKQVTTTTALKTTTATAHNKTTTTSRRATRTRACKKS